MVALRLFWRGLLHLWSRWVDQVAPRGSHRSVARTLGAVGLVLAFALFFIACAGAIAWLFLALITSVEEAQAIALLAVATAFTWMSTIMVVLSAQTLLAATLTRWWGHPFQTKPEPLVIATGFVSFGVAAVCTFVGGLVDGSVSAAQAAGVAVALAFYLLLVRALRATPDAVRTIQGMGFNQLSAHEKLAALSKNQRSNQKTL